jgi:preprotein translocase subunit SecF
MQKNVGKIDSYIRYGIGVVLIVLAIVWQWWLAIPAVIAIATGFLGTCGLYRLFGINTCKIKE